MDDPPVWYTKNEIHHWLICQRYHKEIADELAELIAKNLQLAFEKGWKKAKETISATSKRG